MPSSCDIIIPAYNNAATLPLVLQALFSQRLHSHWVPRLILSDDGSTDQTIKIAQSTKAPPAWHPSLLLSSSHQGAAQARNAGVSASQAEIVLFLGADIILKSGALLKHLEFHLKNPSKKAAALGAIMWDPASYPTPFMDWMTHGGAQNDFDSLLDCKEADPASFFYGSNVSIKTQTLGRQPFHHLSSFYGWEDLELGARLADQGLKLHVLHDAVGLHYHHYSAEQIMRRQLEAGRSLVYFQKRHPHKNILPPLKPFKRTKHTLFYYLGLALILKTILKLTSKKFSTPRLFEIACSIQLWRGVAKESKNTPKKNRI